MGEKLQVSYLVIAGYAIFVVIASLLVGLLPPLVNKPLCKETTSPANVIQQQETIVSDKTFPDFLANVKRRVANQAKIDVATPKVSASQKDGVLKIKSKRDSRNILERTKNIKLDSKARKVFFEKKAGKSYENLTICPEIEYPADNIVYPWYSNRLPDYVIPTLYNIELYVPQWIAPIYDALIVIDLKVTQPTNYIILHNKIDLVLLDELRDAMGNLVNVVCVGEQMLQDYLIIKTDRFLQPNEGTFKLSFFVIEFLTGFKESGIFEIGFDNVQKQS